MLKKKVEPPHFGVRLLGKKVTFWTIFDSRRCCRCSIFLPLLFVLKKIIFFVETKVLCLVDNENQFTPQILFLSPGFLG